VDFKLPASITSTLHWMSDQFHPPAALTPKYPRRNNTPTPMDRKLGGPQSRSGCSGEEKIEPLLSPIHYTGWATPPPLNISIQCSTQQFASYVTTRSFLACHQPSETPPQIFCNGVSSNLSLLSNNHEQLPLQQLQDIDTSNSCRYIAMIYEH
jgi:hypothetical protein